MELQEITPSDDGPAARDGTGHDAPACPGIVNVMFAKGLDAPDCSDVCVAGSPALLALTIRLDFKTSSDAR